MKVESSEYPIHIEVLGNKKLVNFDVEELTTEDNGVSRMYYRYSQLKMHIADSDECITAAETKVRIAEAKAYLASTDFKMTVDYYSRMTAEQQEELSTKRSEARSFLKEQGL